jgi:hypothetical protein
MKFFVNILLGFSLITLLGACETPFNGDGCHDDKIETKLMVDKRIIDSLESSVPSTDREYFRVASGSNIVAVFNFTAGQCDNTFDDEYGYFYAIEIDRESISFSFEGDELINANHYFYEWGAWIPANVTIPISGSVSGIKRSENRWDISADIKASSRDPNINLDIKFEESFSK